MKTIFGNLKKISSSEAARRFYRGLVVYGAMHCNPEETIRSYTSDGKSAFEGLEDSLREFGQGKPVFYRLVHLKKQ